MERMDFEQWLSSLPGAPTPTTAATRSQLTASTLIRHAEKGQTTADNVIAIARAFSVSPVDALVDCGFLRPDEIDTAKVSARQALADIGIEDALRIVVDRVNSSGLFEGEYTVEEALEELGGDDLAARRSNSAGGDVGVVVDDEDALIDAINEGVEKVAAQKRTEPLNEEYT